MIQLARAARAVPAIRRFAEHAASAVCAARPGTFWDLRDAFDALLDPLPWAAFQNAMLCDLADDVPLADMPEWHWHGVTVCQAPAFSLVLTSAAHSERGTTTAPRKDGERLATTLAAPEMLAVLSRVPVRVERYRMAHGADVDVFDPSLPLVLEGVESLMPWTRMDADAPRETFHLVDDDGTAAPTLLTFAASPQVWQRWEFERGTGTPLQPVQTRNEARALLAILAELARAGDTAAIPDVRAMLDHPYHQVRWEAARCLATLDGGVGQAALHMLARDRHPHVAGAAAETLRRMAA
ncbi:HEAT repeat domain-containing protein [Luteibacter yeojuensis]|uniref:HEAT repeat protein n=1 Tax=Luteibacter yeojuensis TaxID=345309 RepID=A0A0F3L1V3_9GAMM|nr:HEAT repeat domain-containing protein [Luteibacter yeojuensis]KJV37376.1 hypothetical protein VI08_00775 [Luteibacter yeojuensis]